MVPGGCAAPEADHVHDRDPPQPPGHGERKGTPMSTRKQPAVPLVRNPCMTVDPVTVGEKPPAEQEVMAHVPGDPVPVPGQGQGPASAGQPVPQGPTHSPVSGADTVTASEADGVAMEQALVDLQTWVRTHGPQLHPLGSGQVIYLNAPTVNVVSAMNAVARLLRQQPDLSPRVDPATLETAATVIDRTLQVEVLLKDLLGQVQDTRRVFLQGPWQDTRTAYHTATAIARTDKSVALALEPVRQVFQRPPRATTAPLTAADLTRRADQATARATKAVQKATK